MNQQQIYQGLEDIYKKPDPWHLENPEIRKSFGYLLELIKLVPHKSILEVGCAQGHFTEMLTPLSSDITAIDISETAIKDARKRVPGVTFAVSSLEDFKSSKKYDVIICSEILYYILDRKKALQKLEELGEYLVTSDFIADFPKFCLGSVKVELALQKYPLIKRTVEHNLLKGELTLKTLRKLS